MKLTRLFQFRCKCGSTRLRRSSRRTHLENAIRKAIRPWRCETCDQRCFKFAWVKPEVLPQTATFRVHALDHMAAAYDRTAVHSDYE